MAAEVINTRYEIIETIATPDTESFGEYKARDISEGRVVTLSILPRERIVKSVGLQTILRASVQQAQVLQHPNICRVFDQGEADQSGNLYVATEYIRGISLKERIRRVAPFSLGVAIDIATSIAEALDAAHHVDVIHGDLRPQSVLLSPEGQIKVTGFAYSLVAHLFAPGQTDPNRASYIAPELSQSGEGSIAGDLYALGAILYEMLTGTLPPAENPADTPPSARALNPGVPPALEGIVQKALQTDPFNRYATAAAMLADLQAVREALRSGRSLAWMPTPEKRTPRPTPEAVAPVAIVGGVDAPSLDEPVVFSTATVPRGTVGGTEAPPAAAPVAAVLPDDTMDDRYDNSPPDPSNALATALKVLFCLVVIGVIYFVWWGTHYLAVPNDITVPNLIGKTFDDSKRIAVQEHFNLVESGSDYSTKWPENQIYQQDPPAGRAIKAGRDVMVYRSLGPRLLTVPDLVGMTQARAARALQEANLPVAKSTEQFNEAVQKGVIVSQTPNANTNSPRDTVVSIVVSKGKQPPDTPEELNADPVASDKVELHWKAAARADTYTVTRILDGELSPIAQGLKDTHFTDKGLSPETAYSYSVTAYNSVGDSGPSDTVPAATPAKTPPVMGDDVQVVPPDSSTDSGVTSTDTGTTDTSGGTSSNAAAHMRQFSIKFRVPRRPRGQHRVQFEVQDATGSTLMYDETRDAGDDIQEPITAFGNKITFRIFLDGKLVKQQTL